LPEFPVIYFASYFLDGDAYDYYAYHQQDITAVNHQIIDSSK
jgi:hypothetical protein